MLIVEDESAVRELVADILASAGYAVREAGNGIEALAVLAGQDSAVDLVLTDVVMPEMNGPSLAAELAARCPEIPVLFMSGYADDQILSQGLDARSRPLLNKPFSGHELRRAVRTMLEAQRDRRP